MQIDPFAHQCRPRRRNEIPAHPSPHKVEVIVITPDIGPSAGDGKNLLFRIVFTGASQVNSANISLIFKWIANMALR
jgi:hypothetical protein